MSLNLQLIVNERLRSGSDAIHFYDVKFSSEIKGLDNLRSTIVFL
jgi:hypothetical protein